MKKIYIILILFLLPLQNVYGLSYWDILNQARVLGLTNYAEQTIFQNSNLHLRVQPVEFDKQNSKWNYKILWNRISTRTGSIYLNDKELVFNAVNSGERETGFIIEPDSINRLIYYSRANGNGVRVVNRGFIALGIPEAPVETIPASSVPATSAPQPAPQPTSEIIPPTYPTSNTQSVNMTEFCQGPTLAISPEEFKPLVGKIVDAPLVNFSNNGQTFWLINGEYGEQKTSGPAEKPLALNIWPKGKQQNELFSNLNKDSKFPVVVNGLPYDTHAWIVNLYQAPDGLLAFVHIEALKDANNWAGRVGLAWSTDNGNTFTYLGHIIQMDTTKSSEPGSNDASNVQGVPYLVSPENPNLPVSPSNPEYFYIYYMERGHGYKVGVARAKVDEVLNSARSGQTTLWKKYFNGKFESNGLGGQATPTNLNGVTHTDATFSTLTKKGYLILTIPSNLDGRNTTRIELHESSNFVDWKLKSVIVSDKTKRGSDNSILDKPGYQYATIINPNGLEQGTIAETMKLLVIHNYDKPEGSDAYRAYLWNININSNQNPVCPNYQFWDTGDFIFNNNVYYSSGVNYCKRTKAVPTDSATRLYSMPTNIQDAGICESKIPAQNFRYNGELYYSNSVGYCKYQNQNADNGQAEVYWSIPSGMKNDGSCNDVPPPSTAKKLGVQNFRYNGELYFSNSYAYCKYQNQNSDNGQAEVISQIPASMKNDGSCNDLPNQPTNKIPSQNFRYNGELFYSNGSAYCKYQNQNADNGQAEVISQIPASITNHGTCNGG
jgi:hypothetical protein